jgi:hypothetical protein
MSQWVQHISGQGQKWLLYDTLQYDHRQAWRIASDVIHFLPISEYHLCEPPEQWVDVSEQMSVSMDGRHLLLDNLMPYLVETVPNVRLCKVPFCGLPENNQWCKLIPQWAFLVERRVR